MKKLINQFAILAFVLCLQGIAYAGDDYLNTCTADTGTQLRALSIAHTADNVTTALLNEDSGMPNCYNKNYKLRSFAVNKNVIITDPIRIEWKGNENSLFLSKGQQSNLTEISFPSSYEGFNATLTKYKPVKDLSKNCLIKLYTGSHTFTDIKLRNNFGPVICAGPEVKLITLHNVQMYSGVDEPVAYPGTVTVIKTGSTGTLKLPAGTIPETPDPRTPEPTVLTCPTGQTIADNVLTGQKYCATTATAPNPDMPTTDNDDTTTPGNPAPGDDLVDDFSEFDCSGDILINQVANCCDPLTEYYDPSAKSCVKKQAVINKPNTDSSTDTGNDTVTIPANSNQFPLASRGGGGCTLASSPSDDNISLTILISIFAWTIGMLLIINRHKKRGRED